MSIDRGGKLISADKVDQKEILVQKQALPPSSDAASWQVLGNWPTYARWAAAGVGLSIVATASVPAAIAGAFVYAGHQAYDYWAPQSAATDYKP